MDIIYAHPEKAWDGYFVSRNPNITWADVQARPDFPWAWDCLSSHNNITLDIIQAHHGIWGWNWHFVSRNPNLTLDFVLAHPDKDWDWYFISKNAHITEETVLNHPGLSWNLMGISKNPNITPQYFGKCITFYLSNNHALTWDVLKQVIDTAAMATLNNELDWVGICKNPHITWDIILAHPGYPWKKYEELFSNPSVFKPMERERLNFYRQVLAVRKIWRSWFRAITDPEFVICRKRLMKDFIALQCDV
jgi:hypothetical protein